ncbi:hypothetical protein F5Y04DRAFT_291186 [Hypomontagnella monticulosa]|nr:hypothetical protein F5Y04DRAFT_291186 [Hypomontagnella monticulosa]
MSAPTEFRYFSRLPPELRYMIWKFYHDQRGVRHYLTTTTNGCNYAAIDIDTNRFIRTFFDRNPPYHAVIATRPEWPLGHPAAGEELVTSYFKGKHFCLVPEAGSIAKSIIASKDPSFLLEMPCLWVRMNPKQDVVFIDCQGLDTVVSQSKTSLRVDRQRSASVFI